MRHVTRTEGAALSSLPLLTAPLPLYRSVEISAEVSVIRDIANRELRLFSDPGRCCRPIFIVEDQKLLIRKQHIMKLRHKEESDAERADALLDELIMCSSATDERLRDQEGAHLLALSALRDELEAAEAAVRDGVGVVPA